MGIFSMILATSVFDCQFLHVHVTSFYKGDTDNVELQMVTSCQNGEWKVMEKRMLEDFPDGVVISLPQTGEKFE